MDAASQTQRYIIRPVSYENIPENLLANISIVKSNKENAVTLPKDAVLTNETQSEFWVMKLVNDSTAVKTVIKPGIREKDKVEILSPDFNEHDLFVASGSYGLPDTATVIITK
jgi:multidrug efflux pump subunit AcrA (membrane-fusion protein)